MKTLINVLCLYFLLFKSQICEFILSCSNFCCLFFFPSPSPNILWFWKLPRFYLCRCFDVIMLFCSIKSVQNKLKEWNIFFNWHVHLHARHYTRLVWKISYAACYFHCVLALSYFLLFFLFFFLEIPPRTPKTCHPWVGRKKTAYLNKVTLSYN